jgi:hypothetical protein
LEPWTRGNTEVAAALASIEQALDRNTAAFAVGHPAVAEEEEESKGEGEPTDAPSSPSSIPGPHIERARTKMLAADVTIPPAYNNEAALVTANAILGERIQQCGGEENAQSAEVIRKILVNEAHSLRALYQPHASTKDRVRL